MAVNIITIDRGSTYIIFGMKEIIVSIVVSIGLFKGRRGAIIAEIY